MLILHHSTESSTWLPRNFITISSITESRFLMRSRQDSRKSMPSSLPFHRSSETTFWLRTMLSRQRSEFLFPAILCSCLHVQTVQNVRLHSRLIRPEVHMTTLTAPSRLSSTSSVSAQRRLRCSDMTVPLT